MKSLSKPGWVILLLGSLASDIALSQVSFFYPDWYKAPTFHIDGSYSASACVAIDDDDLQAAKAKAMQATREEISEYLNGLDGKSGEEGVKAAARGVYLSESQRVVDTDKRTEFFCVLGTIPYAKLEEAMQTGLSPSALADLAREMRSGIVKDPETPQEFLKNAELLFDQGKVSEALGMVEGLILIAHRSHETRQLLKSVKSIAGEGAVDKLIRSARQTFGDDWGVELMVIELTGQRYSSDIGENLHFQELEKIRSIYEADDSCAVCLMKLLEADGYTEKRRQLQRWAASQLDEQRYRVASEHYLSQDAFRADKATTTAVVDALNEVAFSISVSLDQREKLYGPKFGSVEYCEEYYEAYQHLGQAALKEIVDDCIDPNIKAAFLISIEGDTPTRIFWKTDANEDFVEMESAEEYRIRLSGGVDYLAGVNMEFGSLIPNFTGQPYSAPNTLLELPDRLKGSFIFLEYEDLEGFRQGPFRVLVGD